MKVTKSILFYFFLNKNFLKRGTGLAVIRPALCPSHFQKPLVFQYFKVHVGCFVHLKTNYTKKTNVSTIHTETTASDFCQKIIGF